MLTDSQTLSSPAYLRNEEGIKFLVHLLGLHAKLTTDITKAFKSYTPKATKTQLRAYGEVFLLAWKKASVNPDEVR